MELRHPQATAVRRADRDRQVEAAPRAEPVPGELLRNLVEGLVQEAQELDLRHRHEPADGQPDRGTDDGPLGERGVEDPAREAGVQALGGSEHPSEPTDVLAEENHPVALVHGIGQCGPDGLEQSHLALGSSRRLPGPRRTMCPAGARLLERRRSRLERQVSSSKSKWVVDAVNVNVSPVANTDLFRVKRPGLKPPVSGGHLAMAR